MRVALTFDVAPGAGLPFPRFETRGPVTHHFDRKGYFVTTGIGPDLMEGARAAVMRMIDEIAAAQGMSAAEAYMLCSVCADLRISEIVDQPNWVVSLYFPKVVFD
jgi:acetamidase/formamidase